MDGMISTEPKYVVHQHFGQIFHSNESAEEISNVVFFIESSKIIQVGRLSLFRLEMFLNNLYNSGQESLKLKF